MLSKADTEKINLSHLEPSSSSFTPLVTPLLFHSNSSQGPSGWVRQQWGVMSGLTQVFSLGCNLHLFYPSFVLSAGPEPGKQIATVLVLRSSLASVVENGKRMRERGWGCGRKAFGSSRAGMLWFLPLTSSSSQLWSLCHASQFPHHHTDSINRVVSLLLRRSGAWDCYR